MIGKASCVEFALGADRKAAEVTYHGVFFKRALLIRTTPSLYQLASSLPRPCSQASHTTQFYVQKYLT